MAFQKNRKLSGINFWISGAVPEIEYWPHPLYDRDILTFVAQLSRLVLKKGGSIIHGCHPSFTPILVNQHSQVSPNSPKQLKLFVSDFFGSDIAEKYSKNCEVNVVAQVKLRNTKLSMDKSLTKLRERMAANADVVVVLGGKVHQDGQREPGVFEEIRIAEKYGIPIFILPNFKGAAQFLEKRKFEKRIFIDETDLDYLAHMLIKNVEKTFSYKILLFRLLKFLRVSRVN